jgi:hypothetical protein
MGSNILDNTETGIVVIIISLFACGIGMVIGSAITEKTDELKTSCSLCNKRKWCKEVLTISHYTHICLRCRIKHRFKTRTQVQEALLMKEINEKKEKVEWEVRKKAIKNIYTGGVDG